ncbi:MAG: hypothetical protein ACLFRB_01970 [Thiohalorhabdus sp.]|uniref:hypothetical protein n=1 Tax=Thiohalorhabdus sp. TaxID=3094134 RepID=UPI00397F6841
MGNFSELEWKAILNAAESSLKEQKFLIEQEYGLPGEAEEAGPRQWETARQRFRGAHSRLAQLAEQGHPHHRHHLRRVVERLRENAEDLEGRRRVGQREPRGDVGASSRMKTS